MILRKRSIIPQLINTKARNLKVCLIVCLPQQEFRQEERWHWIKARNKYEMFTAKWNETRECKHGVNNTLCFVYVGAVSTLANDCLWWNGVLGYQFIIMFTISAKVYLHLTDIHPTVNTTRRCDDLTDSLLSKCSLTANNQWKRNR